MLDFEAQQAFASYLRASMSQSIDDDIKDVVKAARNALSLQFGRPSDEAKDMLFQQKQMLHVAEQHLQERPWITYFAALKHIIYLRSKGISAATFHDFKDKEYAMEVEKYAERIATSAEAMIDDDTREFLHELIVLQQVEPLIPQCIRTLENASRAPLAERERILFAPEKSLLGKFFSHPSRYEYAIKLNRAVIAAAAEHLKQQPEDWICHPHQTIDYLSELQSRRPLLENTYLTL